MDSGESAKVLGRRWYIVVPVLAGVALAAVFVAGRDTDYQASASMEVLPRYEFGVNTHSHMGQTTLSSVGNRLDTAETRAELEAAGFLPDYTITVDDKDTLMLVKVSDRDPVIAQATVDELIIRVRDELDALQATVNAPTSDLLEIQVTRTSPPQ